MRKLEADRQATTQAKAKEMFDQTARDISFDVGDQVLVFTLVVTGSRAAKLEDR